MASKSITIQSRDRRLLTDLLQSPYDAMQLWQLSQTYERPFTDVHFVRRRMRRLRDAGLVRTHAYLTESAGQLNYYQLSEQGYHLVCGPDKLLPSRGYFRQVAPALQRHVRHVADLLVKIRTSAVPAKVDIPFLLGDNQVRLAAGEDRFVPDAAFGIKAKGKLPQHYLVEVDCGTEPVYSTKERDSLRRKLALYYAHESASDNTYRALFMFSSAGQRLGHFLSVARELAPDPRRHVVLAAELDRFLKHQDPLRWPLFVDHDSQQTSLLPCPDPEAAALVQSSWANRELIAPAPIFG